jgi:hypothetical protein
MPGPWDEIRTRLAARREAVAREDRRDARLAGARLAVFAAALALAWLAFAREIVSAWWLALPAAAFPLLAVRHDRALRARARARRAVAFHAAALARLEDRWAGSGTPGDAHVPPDHLYAQDLDLFGRGSLFELLCAARTRPGEERLAAWLLSPADPDEIRARQGAVRDLSPRLDLREELAVLGDDVRAAVDAASLARWGEAPPLLPGWLGPAGLAVAAASIAAAATWGWGLTGGLPLAGTLLAAWGVQRAARAPLARVLAGLERPAREMEVLALLLGRLEEEAFGDARLLALRAALSEPARASRRIAALRRLAGSLEWAQNQLFAPIAFALAWRPLHGVALERWRLREGPRLRRWLDAVADLEALSSLAGYAHEHPEDPFPEIAPPSGGAVLVGEALRHPLLPGAACVANDVRLGGDGPRALLVSGSNMSGKSTYLRTVGTNVVLALSGAPVRASRMRLSPLSLGATLRIQDSLQAGRSRFYAEITRLRQVWALAAGPRPALFLLDELLHGTNSHDRRIGAEAVLRGLVARGAIGLVTTHDLALTALPGEGGALANAHFEDQVRGGEVVFDYRLRPGVVTHSNALALMRAVGLEV